MKRDYTKNLNNAITDCIANTDKTLNDIISHVFELIVKTLRTFTNAHFKRYRKNLEKFYKKFMLDSNNDYYIIAFKSDDLLLEVMK
jgi:hypothetical protein